ncbi:MAG: sulfotransferase, partial [Myxococcales bacterium]|nr:sulfotransferase [Myxococcales bacterium]
MTVPIHFLCGMSRSGTTWMSLRVNEHPDAAMFGETMYFGRRYLEPKSPPHYSDTELRKAYAALEGSALWNVKVVEGANYNNIDPERPDLVLREAIDNLPRPATPAALFTAVAEAIAEAEGAQVAVEKTPHHLMWIDRIAEAYPEARFVINLRDPYGFTLSYKHQGDRLADHAKDSFGTLYHPAACAMLWRGYARAAQKAQERYGDRIHVVRYDDIQERP